MRRAGALSEADEAERGSWEVRLWIAGAMRLLRGKHGLGRAPSNYWNGQDGPGAEVALENRAGV